MELRESAGMKVRELSRAQELAKRTDRLSFRSGMSTLVDTAKRAFYRDGHIVIEMESGVEVRFPVSQNPRLSKGTPAQLDRIEISPFGLHWPDLDEDLSVRGLLEGDYGQHRSSYLHSLHRRQPNQPIFARRSAAFGVPAAGLDHFDSWVPHRVCHPSAPEGLRIAGLGGFALLCPLVEYRARAWIVFRSAELLAEVAQPGQLKDAWQSAVSRKDFHGC